MFCFAAITWPLLFLIVTQMKDVGAIPGLSLVPTNNGIQVKFSKGKFTTT